MEKRLAYGLKNEDRDYFNPFLSTHLLYRRSSSVKLPRYQSKGLPTLANNAITLMRPVMASSTLAPQIIRLQ